MKQFIFYDIIAFYIIRFSVSSQLKWLCKLQSEFSFALHTELTTYMKYTKTVISIKCRLHYIHVQCKQKNRPENLLNCGVIMMMLIIASRALGRPHLPLTKVLKRLSE